MEPIAPPAANRFEEQLERLRDHRAVGLPVRLYFRRREQVLYLLVGGWNTVFGYGIWALLQFLLGDRLHYLAIVLIGWAIAVLGAYALYRTVVFRSHGPILRELPRFALVYVAMLGANLSLLPLLLRILPLNIYATQAVLMGFLAFCSYLGHKYFSFRAQRHPTGG